MLTPTRDSRLAELSCPKCLGPLGQTEAAIACTACGQAYRYDGDIPDLRVSRFDYYFNPVPRDKMRALTDAITPQAWPQSVRRFVDLAPNPSWIDNVAVHGRYAWKLLMALPPNAAVLDIGCGLGGLLSSVAPHVQTACGTDLTIERLLFSNRRFEVFNRHDDTRLVASGDAAHLPFADARFDAVFLSGVLEWVGEGDTSSFSRGGKWHRLARMLGAHFGETNPRNIQLRFLREIRRILKPGGQLYIGIENRFNHEYFGRRRDHHSGLWFGSLLPRPLATLYSVAAARKPYRTYTYSRRGYRRLFSQAGFDAIELFGFHDGYSNLKSISPIEAEVARWRHLRPTDAARRWSHHPDLVPAFGIVVGKPGPRGSRLIDRLLDEVEERLQATLGFSTFRIDEQDRALLEGAQGQTPIVVKLPMSAAAEMREAANAASLEVLQQRLPAMRDLLPRRLTAGRHQGQGYFVETAARGAAPNGREPQVLASLVRQARERLDSDLRGVGDGVFDRALFDRLLQPRLVQLCDALPTALDAHSLGDALWRKLDGASWRSGPMHGALDLACLRANGDRLSGISDWHAFDAQGWPVVDALLLGWSALQREHAEAPPVRIVQALDDGGWRASSAEPALAACLDDPALTAHQREGLVLVAWAWWAASRLPLGLQYDSAALRSIVLPLLERICR